MEGIGRAGDSVQMINARDYARGQVRIAVFYGYQGVLREAFEWQQAEGGIAVYVDLGYWGRHYGGRWSGYHKVVVNARHPTAYFQNRAHDGSRAAFHGIKPAPWRSGGKHILLAGMGAKAAGAEEQHPLVWEKKVIKALRKHTKRPIIYRPKPSDHAAKPIYGDGIHYSPPSQPLDEVLKDCHAVVTHHSNVAVDGLVAGVPVFVWGGVAMPMGCQDLAMIETPLRPDGREQWVNDIAYVQYSIAEMKQGLAWRYLKDEGLI